MLPVPKPHIMVIDPAVRSPELDCFNAMALSSLLPLTYHLPALHGWASFPQTDADIAGIIILGSSSSVYDSLPWQRTLEDWLRPRFDKGIPVLGICYGHQMLAHMYGGKIRYVQEDQEKQVGVRRIKVSLPELQCVGEREFVVTHNEMVVDIGSDLEVCASSDNIAIDGLRHKSLPIFSLQSHPEATPQFIEERGFDAPSSAQALRDGSQLIRGFLSYAARQRNPTTQWL